MLLFYTARVLLVCKFKIILFVSDNVNRVSNTFYSADYVMLIFFMRYLQPIAI